VFESEIREVTSIVHGHGGQVYVDGANLNALVGLARPADFGADIGHLNLHKTFTIPHGGGGPGVGPVGARSHLAPFLPNHPQLPEAGPKTGIGAVSGAPFGSAGILPIPYAYIRLMGVEGLKEATRVAILSANYVARRLDPYFPVLYTGSSGRVAHECIVDVRPLTKTSGVTAEDVAKRLADYGFHAPTLAFPVANTLMIEPTESESLEEVDRFCDAMISIRAEADRVASGEWPRDDNPLFNAPHTAEDVSSNHWDRSYSRELETPAMHLGAGAGAPDGSSMIRLCASESTFAQQNPGRCAEVPSGNRVQAAGHGGSPGLTGAAWFGTFTFRRMFHETRESLGLYFRLRVTSAAPASARWEGS
jgi:glycine dehydrogenase